MIMKHFSIIIVFCFFATLKLFSQTTQQHVKVDFLNATSMEFLYNNENDTYLYVYALTDSLLKRPIALEKKIISKIHYINDSGEEKIVNVDHNIIEPLHKVYCSIVGRTLLTGVTKIRISIDMGLNRLGDWSNTLKDENGSDIKFNTMMDALNYMSLKGWSYVDAYTIGDSKQGYVYHFILCKEVHDSKEALDGLYF